MNTVLRTWTTYLATAPLLVVQQIIPHSFLTCLAALYVFLRRLL